MAFSFDQAFGIHEQALRVHSQRTSLLAANLANADTPNFKARDIDFASVLRARQGDSPVMRRSDPRHLPGAADAGAPADALYRIPLQPTMDGNTVDTDVELAAFAENAVRYQASLKFLDGRIKGLKLAITGGS